MRVLHLIDAAGPQATPVTLAMLSDALGRIEGVHQDVVLLGGEALRRAAAGAGVHDAEVIGVPRGRAMLGWFSVQRSLRRRPDRRPPPDLVHCWSAGALTLAALMFRSTPRLLTVTVPPSPRLGHWLRMLGAEATGRAVFLPISSAAHRALLGAGLPAGSCELLRPGIDMGRIDHEQRRTVRAEWGIESDDIQVVALMGDPPDSTDGFAASRAMGLAQEAALTDGDADGPLRLLVHPNQHRRRHGEKVLVDLGRRTWYLRDRRIEAPWHVLPGCDLAMVLGENVGLSLLWAMAANVPVVGEATYAVSEIVEDRHSALLAKPGEPKSLAHRIHQLLGDRHLAWQLRDTARHEAYSFFSRQRYARSLGLVYQQVLDGAPLEVPPLEATGGLKFSGRA